MSLSYHDDELERGLLATLLMYPDQIPDVLETVGKADPFTSSSRRKIFAVMIATWNAGEHVDFVSIAAKLPQAEQQELVECASKDSILPTQVSTYAKLLMEKLIRRQLDAIGREASAASQDVEADVYAGIESTQAKLFALTENFHSNSVQSVGATIDESVRMIEAGGMPRISTGMERLDSILGGWFSTDMIIVAGRPSSGKTAFALDQSTKISGLQGIPGGIFSLEMSKSAIDMRLLAAQSGINAHKLRMGLLSEGEKAHMREVAAKMRGIPLFVEDTGGIGITQLHSKARRMKVEHDIGYLIVDYLQLVSGDNKKGREQEVSSISRMLKVIAKELGIPVIVLSQLSRLIEQRSEKRPILSDLRESGSIEQDADVVVFVHTTSNESSDREIIIAKQRNGPLGSVYMNFRSDINRFEEK